MHKKLISFIILSCFLINLASCSVVDTAKEKLVEGTIYEDTASTSEELDTVVESTSTVERGSASASTEMAQIDKDNTTESNIGKTKRHTSQSKRVREFILTLDRFSVKQVISNFPDVPAAIVNNVIRLAKTKGLITCVARGEYVVNKT